MIALMNICLPEQMKEYRRQVLIPSHYIPLAAHYSRAAYLPSVFRISVEAVGKNHERWSPEAHENTESLSMRLFI
jgi:hypothetical protein